jgi:hypothetical protein
VFRAIAVAGGLLALLAGGEWALQAAALGRPAPAELQLVRTLRALSGEHHSQATLVLDGRRYRAVCNQAWYPHRRIAQVVTARLGVITQVGDRLRAAGPLEAGAFELAGCPRPLLRLLSAELAKGATVHFHRANGVYEVSLRPDELPVDVFVAPGSHLPVRLTLNGRSFDGTSRVRYGAQT